MRFYGAVAEQYVCGCSCAAHTAMHLRRCMSGRLRRATLNTNACASGVSFMHLLCPCVVLSCGADLRQVRRLCSNHAPLQTAGHMLDAQCVREHFCLLHQPRVVCVPWRGGWGSPSGWVCGPGMGCIGTVICDSNLCLYHCLDSRGSHPRLAGEAMGHFVLKKSAEHQDCACPVPCEFNVHSTV